MVFNETKIEGAYLIELEPFEDDRGSFARTYCQREFEARGLSSVVAQCNVSRSRRRGALRGMHFQMPPHEEAKLVRCTRGALWDVIIDIRPASPSRGQWLGVELTHNNKQLYIPAGLAHGFQTLCNDTEVFYQMSNFYQPHAASGLRYDDPAFNIDWPLRVTDISDKDLAWPDYCI